jgi:hypothetical protein
MERGWEEENNRLPRSGVQRRENRADVSCSDGVVPAEVLSSETLVACSSPFVPSWHVLLHPTCVVARSVELYHHERRETCTTGLRRLINPSIMLDRSTDRGFDHHRLGLRRVSAPRRVV